MKKYTFYGNGKCICILDMNTFMNIGKHKEFVLFGQDLKQWMKDSRILMEFYE